MSHDNTILAAGNRWLFAGFSILWFALVFFTYWGFHPYYSLSIGKGVNLGIAVVMATVCAGVGVWLQRPGKNKKLRSYNGLMLYGFVLLLQVVFMAIYGSQQKLFTNGAIFGIGYFIVFSLLFHAAIFTILLIHYAIGYILLRALAPWYTNSSHQLLSMAVGIAMLGIIMVIIGQLGLLYGVVIWGLGLAAVIWQRKAVLDFVKSVLWKPYKRKAHHPLWLVPSFLLLIAVAINGIGAIKVIPLGFDGSALYMNTSRLISDYNALPEGGQAYNWSVFMSLGQLMFGKVSLSIMLSHFSGLLAILVLFRIARLFMSAPAAWMAAAFFYLSPAVNFHLTLDEKVDLGFLFITLSTLLLLIEYRVRINGKKELPRNQALWNIGRIQLNEAMGIWALAGLLAGYAFGIKYTGIMSIFALLTYMVYQKAGTRAGMGMLALLFSLLFLGGLYRFGYLEMGTASPLLVGLLALAIAIPLLILGLRGKKNLLKPMGISILLFLVGAGTAFLPWMGKHLSENKRIGISALVEGKSPKPEIVIAREQAAQATAANDPFRTAIDLARRRGISLNADQQNQLRAIIGEYDFQSASPEERIRLGKQVRNRMVKDVLTAQQITQASIQQITGFSSGVGEASELEGAKREEIKRYIGYEEGLPLYLSVPYDVTMNTNVRYLKYLDISFLFLLMLPLLMFSQSGKLALPKNIVLILTTLLIWTLSLYSVYVNNGAAPTADDITNGAEQVLFNHYGPMQSLLSPLFMGIQNGFGAMGRSLHGLYSVLAGFSFLLTFIVLAVLTALSYWLFRERLDKLSANFKGVMAFAFAFGAFWLVLGSAIVWYALPVFALLLMLIAYAIYQPQKASSEGLKTYWRAFAIGVAGLYLLFTTCLNFMSTTESADNADMRFQKSFVLYATRPMTEQEAFFDFNPFLVETVKRINRGGVEDKVYRVGTYFNYHIRYNDQRVYEDNQLELFDSFLDKNRNPRAFLQALKDNGFKYVLYDLYTPGLDNTPEQSLAKKANRFLQLLRSAPEAELIFTDNLVEAPQGQRSRIGRITLPGQLSLGGNVVQQGSFALFELK
jgi:hypothetical protein